VIAHRLIEACALLPLLHVAADGATVVFAVGPAAEAMAADALRWPDVRTVHVLEPLPRLRDVRISVGKPPAGSCDAVLISPDLPAEASAFALAPHGVLCASTTKPEAAGAFYTSLRAVFPRRVAPWREHTPEPLYGALCSPGGKPERLRKPPAAARRLSLQYLPCLFTFGADELPLIFGQAPRPA
jgi:hypothetical protein